MQTSLSPSVLNEGEYPAVAAMTTGYVFRVENQATVMFLQRVARTGHLVTLDATSDDARALGSKYLGLLPLLPLVFQFGLFIGPLGSMVLTAAVSAFFPPLEVLSHSSRCVPAFLLACGIMSAHVDWFLLGSVALLLLSRLLLIASLRARTAPSWHGASEPGVKGDMLILLSQDRWVRLRGFVDDLKAVTSGSWLREAKYPVLMEALEWISRIFVYLATVVLGNADTDNTVVLVLGLLFGHGVLIYTNFRTNVLRLNGRKIKTSEGGANVKSYTRRLDLANELINETGRSDWAVRLGMINLDTALSRTSPDPAHEIVTM
ncbi:hypothetical protein LTR84_011006 [Exophiala bonariae]|uniref:ABC transmembrane type-1 domain-containing protein n=1 Tax=Exophiala bonariae TaxID=1690606 RepID=A0AAV9NHZ2_9EURO|nr:hypothetical protein LTR84_011006 [Exophiala bonariae]